MDATQTNIASREKYWKELERDIDKIERLRTVIKQQRKQIDYLSEQINALNQKVSTNERRLSDHRHFENGTFLPIGGSLTEIFNYDPGRELRKNTRPDGDEAYI